MNKTKSPFFGGPDTGTIQIPNWSDSWNPFASPFFGDPSNPGTVISQDTGAKLLAEANPAAAPAHIVNQVASAAQVTAADAIPSKEDFYRLVKVGLLYASNASITQSQSAQSVNSSVVDMALSETLRNRPYPGTTKMAAGAGLNSVTNLTFGQSDIGEYVEVGLPWVYFTIAASPLNAKAGALITCSLTGKTATQVVVAATPWTIKREDASRPVRVIMFPYVMMANRPLHQTIVVGTIGGVEQSFTLSINGLDTNESVTLEVPGYSMGSLREIAMKFAFPSGISF